MDCCKDPEDQEEFSTSTEVSDCRLSDPLECVAALVVSELESDESKCLVSSKIKWMKKWKPTTLTNHWKFWILRRIQELAEHVMKFPQKVFFQTHLLYDFL